MAAPGAPTLQHLLAAGVSVKLCVQATAEGTGEELAVRRSVVLKAEHGDTALRALSSLLPELDAELGALATERRRVAQACIARAAELQAKREAMAREITQADEELAQLAAKGFVILGDFAAPPPPPRVPLHAPPRAPQLLPPPPRAPPPPPPPPPPPEGRARGHGCAKAKAAAARVAATRATQPQRDASPPPRARAANHARRSAAASL